ncbi:4-coumarate--CoA ligase 1-like isoform X1 [Vespula pensylvanica]|nr:4-coumarate--CoA ligase 1-like isoform X1 [Vespula pensylvanica]
MVADKSITNAFDFIIKDNILKGKDEPLSTEYTNVGKLLLDRMKARPDFVGQMDIITEETYTFAEMFDRTVKCALWLRQQGIKNNDVVAVCAPNIMDSFAPFFAIFCVGATFTPWNSAMDIREARYFMKLSGAKIVFADENSVNTILEAAKLDNNNIKVVVFGKISNVLPFSKVLEGHSKSDVENFECAQIDNIHDTAALLYSSGTTGLPKGVTISHFALLCNLVINVNWGIEGIPLWLSSYFWISGVLLTLKCTVNYCKRLLYPKFEEETTCKIIEKYKVTWVFLSPSMINRILKAGYFKKYDVSSITKVYVGGAIFTAKSQIQLQECLPHADVIQMYGMTELCGVITAQKPNHKAGTVGTVTSNAQLKIIDLKTGNALGPDQAGELLTKSIMMTKGYYNNPQATKDTIDADGWLHTGDIAYYDENGELFILDRLKETMKYRGFQISPSEIENLLQSHPDVIEVAVVGVPHLEDDEHPIAFIIKVPGSKVSEGELRELVEKNMTDSYHLRGGIKFLDKMPHTPSGKISRKDLKVMAKNYQTK